MESIETGYRYYLQKDDLEIYNYEDDNINFDYNLNSFPFSTTHFIFHKIYVINNCNKEPHVCPVCHGTKTVPSGFYDSNGFNWSSTVIRETCRTCNGAGIVWW